MKTRSSEYIHFGCGLCAPVNWRNFDAGPAFWLQHHFPILKRTMVRRGYPDYPRNIEYGNVIKGLPVQPLSAKAVYCSHVLEHLTLTEFRQALDNVYKYLQQNGTFRLVVPDLEYLATTYLNNLGPDAASHFMRSSFLGEKDKRGASWLLRQIFSRAKHYWMWDYHGLSAELRRTGFVDIRRAYAGDSSDPAFACVEDPGRWLNCLGIECHK